MNHSTPHTPQANIAWRSLRWIADWLLAPARRCTMLLLMGMAAWVQLWHQTHWTSESAWTYAPQILLDIYVVAMLVCLLPRKIARVVMIVIYVQMYLLGWLESFLYQRFYMHLSPQTLFMVQETNPQEATGFLDVCTGSSALWLTLLWWGLLVAAHVGLAVAARRLAGQWPKVAAAVRTWLPAVVIPVCLACAIWWWPARKDIYNFLSLQRTDLAERADNHVFCSAHWRLVYAVKFLQLANGELQTLATNMQQIGSVESHDGIPCVVWVIGESYNKHHSAVYGYGLPTTPFQTQSEARGLMVAMDDAVTPWNVTSNTFKQMLSTHSTDQPGLWTDGVLFPALIKRAGYEVTFHSAQFYISASQNAAYFNGSFFLNGQPFDSLCFNNRNSRMSKYDADLLATMPQTKCPKQFMILHLMGQHLPYHARFPKASAHFTKDDIDRPDLGNNQRQIVADYDNATLYNDSILRCIYELYKDREAVIVYTADHGDEVYDGKMRIYGRNHKAMPSADVLWAEFEVPLEVWLTPALQQKRPELMAQLKAAKQRPFSIDDISHMLLNLTGVQTKYYNPERDLLSPQFKARPRPVKGTNRTYDEIMNQHRADQTQQPAK